MLLTKKQRKKERKKERKKLHENNTPSPYRGWGNHCHRSLQSASVALIKDICTVHGLAMEMEQERDRDVTATHVMVSS